MSNTFFRFKQFTVHHDRCAMKVGTDGVLLGALAEGGRRILDIGTGTGLVALMMAQRCPAASITAIDIDHDACLQAEENAGRSPFAERVEVVHAALADYTESLLAQCEGRPPFDAIVCNPPFFEEDTPCPDSRRTVARHTSSLPFASLIACAARLLAPGGTFTIITPTVAVPRIEEECAYANLFISRRIHIKTVERKEPRRTVIAIVKASPAATACETHCLMQAGERSDWYRSITHDFYL